MAPWGETYIENKEGFGTAVELRQLVLDLVHEVAVTWVACGTGGVDRGDGKRAPRSVFPVQNQQQGHNSWEQAGGSHEQGGGGVGKGSHGRGCSSSPSGTPVSPLSVQLSLRPAWLFLTFTMSPNLLLCPPLPRALTLCLCFSPIYHSLLSPDRSKGAGRELFLPVGSWVQGDTILASGWRVPRPSPSRSQGKEQPLPLHPPPWSRFLSVTSRFSLPKWAS